MSSTGFCQLHTAPRTRTATRVHLGPSTPWELRAERPPNPDRPSSFPSLVVGCQRRRGLPARLRAAPASLREWVATGSLISSTRFARKAGPLASTCRFHGVAALLLRGRSSSAARTERRCRDGRRAKVLAVAAVALASLGKPGVAHTRPSPSRYPTTRPPLTRISSCIARRFGALPRRPPSWGTPETTSPLLTSVRGRIVGHFAAVTQTTPLPRAHRRWLDRLR